MKSIKSQFFFLHIFILGIFNNVSGQCDVDSIPPQILVVNLSTAVLSESAEVELYAIDFIIYSNDNCTSSDSLRYTFGSHPDDDSNFHEEHNSSSKIYDCMDVVNSPVVIDVYAWDLDGNSTNLSVYTTFVANGDVDCSACEDDTIAPTSEFIPQLTAILNIDQESIELWASDFAISSSDNCTATSLLRYSFEPTPPNEDNQYGNKLFDCLDAQNSPIEVDVYVWDKNDNYIMGTSSLDLQLPADYDCTGGIEEFTGTVSTINEEPIIGATVFLENEDGEVLQSTTTDDQGEYSFMTNRNDKYCSIDFESGSEPVINVLDMVELQRHLLGLISFSAPQYMAGDLNNDGFLKIDDLKMLRKALLGVINLSDYINTEWQFVDKNIDIFQSQGMTGDRFFIGGDDVPGIVGYRIGDIKQ